MKTSSAMAGRAGGGIAVVGDWEVIILNARGTGPARGRVHVWWAGGGQKLEGRVLGG